MRNTVLSCVAVWVMLGAGCGDDAEQNASTAGEDAGHDAAAEPASGQRLSRLYVANTESESVSVIDHERREVIATLELGNKPHGHAPSSAGDRIYVTTDGGKGEVIAIDTADNEILWRLELGTDLNEPHITRDDAFVYAPDLLKETTYVVDVRSQQQVAAIDTPGIALHNTYASHDGRHIYVTAILSSKIFQIDVATNEVVRTYELNGAPRPAAITKDDATMYVQLSELHGFIALDLDSGEESARVEWPEPDSLPPSWGTEGPLETKCHGLKLTPDGKQLWANTNMENATYVYSVPELQMLARIELGESPNWIAFSGDGTTAYITNADCGAANSTVSVVDVKSHRVVDTLDVGKCAKRIHLVELPVAEPAGEPAQ